MPLNTAVVGCRTLHRASKSPWTSWQQPVTLPKKYRLFCCDCGLAHNFQFRIGKDGDGHDRVQFRVSRADSYTQAHRKLRSKGRKPKIIFLKKGEAVRATVDGAMVITLVNGLRRGGAKIVRKPKRK